MNIYKAARLIEADKHFFVLVARQDHMVLSYSPQKSGPCSIHAKIDGDNLTLSTKGSSFTVFSVGFPYMREEQFAKFICETMKSHTI